MFINIYTNIWQRPTKHWSLDDTPANKGKESSSLFKGVPASLFACLPHSRQCQLCDTASIVCCVKRLPMSGV